MNYIVHHRHLLSGINCSRTIRHIDDFPLSPAIQCGKTLTVEHYHNDDDGEDGDYSHDEIIEAKPGMYFLTGDEIDGVEELSERDAVLALADHHYGLRRNREYVVLSKTATGEVEMVGYDTVAGGSGMTQRTIYVYNIAYDTVDSNRVDHRAELEANGEIPSSATVKVNCEDNPRDIALSVLKRIEDDWLVDSFDYVVDGVSYHHDCKVRVAYGVPYGEEA